MKTKKETRNWKVNPEEKLSARIMMRLRGGDGGEDNPEGPIVKGP
jgi:hypothetical protein